MTSGGFHDLNVGVRGPHAAELQHGTTDHRRRTGPPDHRTGDGRPDFEVIGEGLRLVRGYDGEPAWQLALVRRQ